MSQWMRTLDIKKEWQTASKDGSYKELATAIADKLAALAKFGPESDIDLEKQDVIAAFRDFGEEDSVDVFDSLMEELYDWADISLDDKFGGKKVCWVKTF